MSSPKKPFADQAATILANPVPGQGGSSSAAGQGDPKMDRRTAALPQAPVPTSAPHDRTMTFDPASLLDAQVGGHPQQSGQGSQTGRNRPPMQTVVTPHKPVAAVSNASGGVAALPPTASTAAPAARPQPPRPKRAVARWFVGPLLAGIMGAATMLAAGFISASQPHPVTRGKLNISSEPEGATIVIEGKVYPHATPTVIEGDIGATLRVGFKLDGYLDRDAEVFVGEGERPFRVKLERRDAPPPRQVDPDDADMLAPNLAPTPNPTKHDDDKPRPKKDRDKDRDKDPGSHRTSTPKNDTVAPPMGGMGSLSVHVRPWAIVYIDGAKIRQTPVSSHQLTAGLHSVELVNDDLQKKEKVTVEIRANANEEIHRKWD